MLNREMKNLVGDFDQEIKSVNSQFLVFLFAYVTRCLILIPLEIKEVKKFIGENMFNYIHIVSIFFL